MNQSFACLVSRGARWRTGRIYGSPCPEHQRRGRQHERKPENAHLLWSMNQLSLGAKVLDSVLCASSRPKYVSDRQNFSHGGVPHAQHLPDERGRTRFPRPVELTSHRSATSGLGRGSRFPRANYLSRPHHQSSAAGESCGKARCALTLSNALAMWKGARAAFTGSRRDSAAGGRRWVEDGVRILLLRDAFSLYECSRGGGTRTPGLRFWRPPLYQLSYAPGLMGL